MPHPRRKVRLSRLSEAKLSLHRWSAWLEGALYTLSFYPLVFGWLDVEDLRAAHDAC